MSKLQTIDGLSNDSIELLEAVGYLDVRDLCDANLHELLNEMEKANDLLHIMPTSPTFEMLESWKKLANCGQISQLSRQSNDFSDDGFTPSSTIDRSLAEGEDAAFVSKSSTMVDSFNHEGQAVNFENDPKVRAMLEGAPEAQLVPVNLLKENNIRVSDIAKGVLLSECQGDVEMKVMTSQQIAEHKRHLNEVRRTALLKSRIRNFDDANNGNLHVKPLSKGETRDVVTLSEGLNAGLKPSSRRFIRGVLHPEPWKVKIAAFFSVLAQFFLAIFFIGAISLIIYNQMYEVPHLEWWIGGLGIGLVLSGLSYLIWGLRARCRICGQRQFAPKMCLKNRKAHHIKLIGYILPTALHAMFYHWFYCIYCGTAVRLKK